jgi:hypothetical protein
MQVRRHDVEWGPWVRVELFDDQGNHMHTHYEPRGCEEADNSDGVTARTSCGPASPKTTIAVINVTVRADVIV